MGRFSASIRLVCLMLITGVAKTAEPPGASLAFTSTDPTVVQAVVLLRQGKLHDAQTLLKTASPSAPPEIDRAAPKPSK